MKISQNRFYGAFYGSVLGDILGAPYEFENANNIKFDNKIKGGGPFDLPIGAFTDDTSMMLCLAQSLIDCKESNPEDQLKKYVNWYRRGYMSSIDYCFDIGNQTVKALHDFEKYNNTIAFKTDSAGNGALMRCVPALLIDHANKIQTLDDSIRTTHNNHECILYNIMFKSVFNKIVDGTKKEDINLSYKFFTDTLMKNIDVYLIHGYVKGSTIIAIKAFFETDTFEESMNYAISLGGDTDTNACITGILSGAYYGYESLLKYDLSSIMKSDILRSTCDSLYNLYQELSDE